MDLKRGNNKVHKTNIKKVHCIKCKNEFSGDFSTIGMAQKRHKFCEECIDAIYQSNKKQSKTTERQR
ncbi:hypothetical protein CN357_03355 [Bacillus cereus]|uniref:Uncharacterized protein n=1 Tax=Bacillus cereus TaxID=1396 RepID=A0A9X6W2B5_BACCE|nr:hypothetical protein CN357_03355 [Bacillus cereus]PGB10130.1 hypothetical protein COM09_23990 [Bacillus toyonensis]